jgi:hypothetical protein
VVVASTRRVSALNVRRRSMRNGALLNSISGTHCTVFVFPTMCYSLSILNLGTFHVTSK